MIVVVDVVARSGNSAGSRTYWSECCTACIIIFDDAGGYDRFRRQARVSMCDMCPLQGAFSAPGLAAVRDDLAVVV
jgi:hypothetical protein